jgi:hypothetical protein
MAWHIRFGLFFRVIRKSTIRANVMTQFFREKSTASVSRSMGEASLVVGSAMNREHLGCGPLV